MAQMTEHDQVHQCERWTGAGEKVSVPAWQGAAQDDVAEWAVDHWKEIANEQTG